MPPSAPRILTLGSRKSKLGFTTTGGGSWPEWDRFLTLNGKPAYHLGNICDTCAFFFQRLDGATWIDSAEQLGALLAAGPPTMDIGWLRDLGASLPAGDYIPFYAQTPVRLVSPGGPGDYFAEEQVATWGVDPFYGLPHDPGTEYYRGRVVPLEPSKYGSRAIFELVVPMFPSGWLDEARTAEYRAAPAASPPTALALSVLDVKGPADWDEQTPVVEHWCLAHYLLDGHHKAYAAATSGTPLGLLSFLAVPRCIASPEQALEAVSHLASRVAS